MNSMSWRIQKQDKLLPYVGFYNSKTCECLLHEVNITQSNRPRDPQLKRESRTFGAATSTSIGSQEQILLYILHFIKGPFTSKPPPLTSIMENEKGEVVDLYVAFAPHPHVPSTAVSSPHSLACLFHAPPKPIHPLPKQPTY